MLPSLFFIFERSGAMTKRKEFSILKWIVFPANSIVLASIIAYFNITVFGLRDGLPYSIIVGMIGLFSIVIVKYAESENRSLARAAFVFEIVLTCALVVNACYSVSVQRKMSVAKMAETNQKETITEIGKLRGSRTQREALKKIDKQETAQTVFAGVEDILFWIMAAELALYGLSAFTLFALAKLLDGDESKSRAKADQGETWPEEIETGAIEKRSPSGHEKFTKKKEPGKNLGSFNSEGLRHLREALKGISFRLAGFSFKANVKDDCVWILMMKARAGTQEAVASAKAKLSILDDALKMERNAFRERLEDFLRKRGFEL
jgi:hypothetical protein